jgi:hypothetical protein
MAKLRLVAVILAVLLMAAPLMGVSRAEDNYTLQYITTVAGPINYIGYIQAISGFTINSFTDSGRVTMNFNNASVSGIYNQNIGIGSFRNQGSVAMVNIMPTQDVTPAIFYGQMYSLGNRVNVGDYNYAVNLNFNNFTGAGIVVLNIMAGSFCNQFTSVSFNMGRNAVAAPSTTILSVIQGNPTTVSLSNQQMKMVAATADNDIQTQGKQNAVANIQGIPNIQGVSAITLSAGINNQISHHVEVNVDTAR